ncbi:MAG: ATP-binding cassette domain-containing protein [Pedobacter sp.]|nr:ATP-binding cassette domain-containing protein [Pedobacter sp.]MDQ8052499.1 ATP-binding cassette domain-containing protein [Pedobacter sp.]
MQITLTNIGRRFNKEWIFRNIDYTFIAGESYAVLGPNGSGKSTLLNLLLGSLTPSEGTIAYERIKEEAIYQQVSFAAPYLDLIEEFTLQETIDYHFQFKDYAEGMDALAVLNLLGLEQSQDKALKHFSSGMKQRTKLALACCAATPILILDEPTSNLDEQGVVWYHDLVNRFAGSRTTIIGSNQKQEYAFCKEQLLISDYKS